MVTEVDYQAMKIRIADIFKSITSGSDPLWQPEGHEKGFLDIVIGMPDNNVFGGGKYPICYITNHENLDEDKPFGPQGSNGSAGSSEHLVRYNIVLYDHASDAVQIEKQLDILTKKVKETIKGNLALKDPTDDDDPQCTWCWPSTTKAFAATLNGKPLDGRVIELQCKVHTS